MLDNDDNIIKAARNIVSNVVSKAVQLVRPDDAEEFIEIQVETPLRPGIDCRIPPSPPSEDLARAARAIVGNVLSKAVQQVREVACQMDQYAQLAHELVDIAISRAWEQLSAVHCEQPLPPQRPVTWDTNIRTCQLSDPVINIQWMTIDEFTPERGEDKIHEFIKTWYYSEGWKYCIDQIGVDDLEFDTRYRYRVRWSIPTRRTPIPRQTASVYFTLEVSKVKPKDYPVEVYYVFETNKLVHRPGKSKFQEKWLKNIIESKVKLLDGIDF